MTAWGSLWSAKTCRLSLRDIAIDSPNRCETLQFPQGKCPPRPYGDPSYPPARSKLACSYCCCLGTLKPTVETLGTILKAHSHRRPCYLLLTGHSAAQPKVQGPIFRPYQSSYSADKLEIVFLHCSLTLSFLHR